MEPHREADSADLGELRRRRAELRDSMGALEQALAVATASPGWVAGARTAVHELSDDVDEHIEVTEGPGGLHQAILDGDLRLANAVIRLAEEHAVIQARVAELVDHVDADRPDIEDVRDHGTGVLALLVRHRQRGADLIFEAYETDIGGET